MSLKIPQDSSRYPWCHKKQKARPSRTRPIKIFPHASQSKASYSAQPKGSTMARLLIISLFTIVGFTAAFFKQAVPHQEAKPSVPVIPSSGNDVFDELDNPNVVSDSNITPARKCGFCMGVSLMAVCGHCLLYIPYWRCLDCLTTAGQS